MVGTELEVEEVDHVAAKDAVGDISKDPGKDQHPSPLHEKSREVSAQDNQKHKDCQGKNGEEAVAVMHHAERSARVIDMGEAKKSGDDRHSLLKADLMDDGPLGGLIGNG